MSKRQKSTLEKKPSYEAIIKAIQTEPDLRDQEMLKELKNYVKTFVPLMENGYCSKDDYSFLVDQLKYKFVKKGHYAVRQGEVGDKIYFIIKGSADVMAYGPPSEHVYLD